MEWHRCRLACRMPRSPIASWPRLPRPTTGEVPRFRVAARWPRVEPMAGVAPDGVGPDRPSDQGWVRRRDRHANSEGERYGCMTCAPVVDQAPACRRRRRRRRGEGKGERARRDSMRRLARMRKLSRDAAMAAARMRLLRPTRAIHGRRRGPAIRIQHGRGVADRNDGPPRAPTVRQAPLRPLRASCKWRQRATGAAEWRAAARAIQRTLARWGLPGSEVMPRMRVSAQARRSTTV